MMVDTPKKRKQLQIKDPGKNKKVEKTISVHLIWVPFSHVERVENRTKLDLRRQNVNYFTLSAASQTSSQNWQNYESQAHVVLTDFHVVKRVSRLERIKFILAKIRTARQASHYVEDVYCVLPAMERVIEPPKILKTWENQAYEIIVKHKNEEMVETESEWYNRVMGRFFNEYETSIDDWNQTWLGALTIVSLKISTSLIMRIHADVHNKQSTKEEVELIDIPSERIDHVLETFIFPELYFLQHVSDKAPLSFRYNVM